ncbi:MAG: hypothetical protein FJ288_10415 [Planctomycetes bacterium]|nr:hypothetical protein [Planctomycetota bacterium]
MPNLHLERLKRLPQRANETWQGGIVRMPAWVTGDGPRPFRPVTAMWVSLRTGLVHTGEGGRRPEEKDFAMALDALVGFATDEKLAGYRPGKLEVNDPALAEHLAGLLAEAGVRVEHCARLPALERCLKDLAEHLNRGPLPPGAMEGKAVTIERLRPYAEAAKMFFEAAPWQHLSNEDLIAIEAPAARPDMRFAVVMGAGGQEYGLGFYRSIDQYWEMVEAEQPGDFAPDGLWAVNFDDITEIPMADADLWEDHGLPVAGDRAYPWAIRYESRGRLRRPGADVLVFFEGLLRALAATTVDEMDSGRWTKRVETADGLVEYRLSLPFLLKPPTRQELHDHGRMLDRRAMEQLHAQMDRFLEGKTPQSVEELNALIQKEFLGKTLDPTKHSPRTPLEKAQDLCYQAFDAIGRRQVKLAREALAISPDCADAYVLLAENTPDKAKALDLYAKGIEAGRRALGEEIFREDAGRFWGINRTRPFMRALMGLATTQERLGRREEAIGNYQELLRLNANDNQGVRDLLLPLLLVMGCDAEAQRLLAQYETDATALWAYLRALLAFRKEGDSAEARRLLERARKVNPYVPRHLLGEAEPVWSNGRYSLGSPEEAAFCAETCAEAWRSSPGALDWLAAIAGISSSNGRRSRGSAHDRQK